MTNEEINEAVALKLPGWHKSNCDCRDAHHDHWTRNRRRCLEPNYTASIEAAWEIVERMNFSCNVVSVVCEVKTFFIQFANMGEILNGPCADTAPMAICLAFLKLKDGTK